MLVVAPRELCPVSDIWTLYPSLTGLFLTSHAGVQLILTAEGCREDWLTGPVCKARPQSTTLPFHHWPHSCIVLGPVPPDTCS